MLKDCRTSSRVAKKRIGHCPKTVQNVVNTVYNNSRSCSVLYNKTRVIYNSVVNNGCSSNWRADWSRLLGRSYAEVVGSNPAKRVHEDQKRICPGNYLPEDKYQLALAIKNKNKHKLQRASSDPTYQKWSDQNSPKFGFVPLGPLLLPNSNLKLHINADPNKLYVVTKMQIPSILCLLKFKLNPS